MASNDSTAGSASGSRGHNDVQHITHLRAADVIGDRTEIYALRPEDTVERAAQKLKDWHVRTSAVTDDVGNVVGVFGQSDIASRVVAAGLDAKTVHIRDVLTHEPICADVETDMLTLVHLMRTNGISHVVLTRTNAEGEQYFGMLSANDVLGVVARMGSDGAFWFQQIAGETSGG